MTSSLERSLVLIKPDGVARNLTGEVLRRIETKGYVLADLKMLTASDDLLGEHARQGGSPTAGPP